MKTFALLTFITLAAWLATPLRGEEVAETQPAELALPHMHVDRDERLIDVEAEVVLREAEWIELLACTPKTREYESILSVKARPSHIHLALITLGLKPGASMKWHYTDTSIDVEPPRGPRLGVSIVTTKDEKQVETPASHWVLNQKTGKTLDDSVWLFTGSGFADLNGQQVYRADIGGTVISVVNFGDDMLARQTTATNHTDEAQWTANTKMIPPVGTKVTLRLRVMPEPPPQTQPADE